MAGFVITILKEKKKKKVKPRNSKVFSWLQDWIGLYLISSTPSSAGVPVGVHVFLGGADISFVHKVFLSFTNLEKENNRAGGEGEGNAQGGYQYLTGNCVFSQ